MKPSSQDLRDRLIQAREAGTETQRVMAERLCVRGSFVEPRGPRWRQRGSSAVQPPAGGRQSALTAPLELLRRAVATPPDATRAAWRNRIGAAPGPRGRPATSCRAVQA